MGSEKNKWMLWVIVIGVVIVTLIAFNYHGDKSDTIPLSEIFPEEVVATEDQNIEYEFVDGPQAQAPAAAAPVAAANVKPAAAKPAPSKFNAAAVSARALQPAVTPGPATVTAPAAPVVSGDYSIQVLSSKDKAATEKSLGKVQAKGHAAYIVTRDMGEKGTWYRVNVGPFQTKAQADEYLPKVQADYKDSFVIGGKKK